MVRQVFLGFYTFATKFLPLQATSEDIKSLDLYANLTALPKNVDASRDPMKLDVEEQTESAMEEGRAVTSREIGRLKHKKALAERFRQDDESEEVRERESKKLKSDTTCADDQEGIEDL
jgi:tRNA (guanine-N(7)-)-methyltransferase subunit TRM82